MKTLAAGICVALAALATGCDREAVRTVVIAPAGSAASAPGATTAPSAPSAPAPAAPTGPVATTTPAEPAPPQLPAQAGPPVPAVTQTMGASADGASLLAGKSLVVPVAGIPPESLSDTYNQARGGRKHEAMDIMAARGTPVYAVEDGKVAKLFNSIPGGITLYQFDPTEQLTYYYAHLDRYADGVKEGMALKKGDLIGYVGSTGNANPQGPHLHFAVFRLGPEKQWWKGEPVNPYPALKIAQASR